MKSTLHEVHEGSSVAKAIEKAWTAAGKPTDFTIAVLEKGERNFFGFCKKPAIVSIAYHPAPQVIDRRSRTSGNKQQQSRQQPQAQNAAFGKQAERTPDRKQQVSTKARINEKAGQQVQKFETATWEQEQVHLVEQWLQELLSHMGFQAPLETKIDKTSLLFVIQGDFNVEGQEERAVCQTLAHLLLQFLKRRFKKRFTGLHIAVTTKYSNGEQA